MNSDHIYLKINQIYMRINQIYMKARLSREHSLKHFEILLTRDNTARIISCVLSRVQENNSGICKMETNGRFLNANAKLFISVCLRKSLCIFQFIG